MAALVNLFIASEYIAMDGVAGVLTAFSFLHTVGSLICFPLLPFVLLQAKYFDLMGQYSQPALRAKVAVDYPLGCAGELE